MNPPKKQHLPGHLQSRQQQPLKSGGVQLKSGPVKPQIKRPIAPPVYRPQPTPRVLQTKAVGNFRQPQTPPVGQKPIAPPVYRPQPVPHVLQRKTAVGQPPPGQSRPQPPKPPAILRPAAKNIAQPKMGTTAQRLSPPPAIRRAGVVQRYQAVDGGGAVDQFTFDERAGEASRGFNGWGSLNRGWARVITAAGATHIFRANSMPGAHTEEALLALVFAAYPNIRNDRPDPNVGGVNRLVELYTERQPCTAHNADYQRTQRHNTNGNCHAYLTAAVHDSVRVSYSVAHSEYAHGALMNSARQIYANQIASGARRLTLAEATNNNIHNYQTPIRQRSHTLHGHYGRDYEGDLAHHNALLAALNRDCGVFCKAMSIDIRTPLRQAFEAGAHAAGSDPVRAAMDAAAQQIRDEVAGLVTAIFSEPFSLDKDKKPPGGGGGKGSFVGSTVASSSSIIV